MIALGNGYGFFSSVAMQIFACVLYQTVATFIIERVHNAGK